MYITTRYIPATDIQGAQVIARATSIPPVYIPYKEGLDSLGNHLAAARIIANRCNHRIGGITRRCNGFLFTAYQEKVRV